MPLRPTTLVIALLFFGLDSTASAAEPFKQGVEAFRAGNYPLAAANFEAAESTGVNSPKLQFNLGSTYIKLGRYRDAQSRFERIADDPDWGPLAQYNLGLIDQHEQNLSAAREHYRAALAATTSERLRSLASSHLAMIDASPEQRSNWFGLLSITGGYDDNVTLTADPSILGVTDESDEFTDVSAAVSGYVLGTYESGLRLDLSAFGEFYRQLNDFNEGLGSAGFTWSELAGAWYFETGAKGDIETVGHDVLAQGATFSVRASHPLGLGLRLRLRGEGSRISGASSYDYLTGYRARGGAEIQSLRESGRISVGYLYEYNNRDNLETATEFLDYSPTRNTGYMRIEQTLGERVIAEVRAEYADSSYSDEDRIPQSNHTTLVEKRQDTSWTFGARLAWKLSRNTSLFADYAYANVDSSIDPYRYKQNRAMAGIEVGM